MDAITLLKADHKKVGELLEDIKGLSQSAHVERRKLFEQIDRDLTVHSKIEETIFYPALKKKAQIGNDDDAKQEVLEAYEEHSNVKGMLKKLERTEATDETYNAKLQVLGELVKHHVHEEEHEMFREARDLMSETELDALGVELARAKEELMSGGPA
ncbi:MAG: hemerythrin [Candidatus Meridianibacter frigidus]|nr:MAG: hemerythrin [Candidatus Eremiobacteraeota bacterium]